LKQILLCTIALLVVACAEESATGLTFDTASVSHGTIEVNVSSAGVVEPLATIEVKSKASGEVLDLLVETGDLVEAGTLLVRIDPRIVRNRLDQAEAELKAASSRRKIAQSQMQRAKSLMQTGTFTESDLEQAALDLANAEAMVVTARVSVENARIAVGDTDVRAPITGTVILKPVEKGQVISSPTQDFSGGSLLLTMADLGAVQIRMLVNETDIGKVRPGMSATVTVTAYPNQPFPGEVTKIEPQAIDIFDVTIFEVLISIGNPDGMLMPGMNAEVDVRIARSEDVLTVPIMALRTNRDVASTASILNVSEEELRQSVGAGATGQRRGAGRDSGGKRSEKSESDYRFGGKFWVIMESNGSYEFKNVQTGITDLDRVEIVAGLEEADRVLVLPSTHLFETQQDLQKWIKRRVGGVPGISN
jgi:HlyD family secretion protein